MREQLVLRATHLRSLDLLVRLGRRETLQLLLDQLAQRVPLALTV